MTKSDDRVAERAAEEIATHESNLTWAERQLGTEGRAQAVKQHYIRRDYMFVTAATAWGALAVAQGAADPARLAFGVLLLVWAAWKTLHIKRIAGAMDQLLVTDEPGASADDPVREQAEALVERHVSELTFAELQLRKSGDYAALVDSLCKRRVWYLLIGGLISVYYLALGSWVIGSLIGVKVVWDVTRALRTRAAFRRLSEGSPSPADATA